MATMTFRNYGGAYQLRIESADDLRAALDLPEALWVATSAPVGGFACDPVFLSYRDTDCDGRIRADELREAIRWTFRMLSSPERLADETDWLRLGDLNVAHEDGARAQAVAERIVAEKADAVFLAGVTLAQVRARLRALEQAPNSGDGTVPPAGVANLPVSSLDSATTDLGRTITDAAEPAKDASGQSGSAGEELARTRDLEKLILFQRWLIPFANNFIGFAHFYDPARPALFGQGRLVIGGRDIAFAVRVTDRQAHRAAAGAASLHVLYVTVIGRLQTPTVSPGPAVSSGPAVGLSPAGSSGMVLGPEVALSPQVPLSAQVTASSEIGEAFEVACPVTAGDVAGLGVGKRGIFLTPDGRVWDAQVTDCIAHPASLVEAARAPFDRIGRSIQRTAGRWGLAQRLQDLAAEPPTPEAVGTAKPARGAVDARGATPQSAGLGGQALAGGFLAAILSVAALIAATAYAVKTFQIFTFWRAVAAVLVLLALPILPSMLLGWLRLRRRNLAALLEASGWAINPRLYVRRSLGRLLTHRPRLPEGSVCERRDLVRDFAVQFAEVSPAPLARVGSAIAVAVRAGSQAMAPLARRLRGTPSDKPPTAG